MHRVLRTDLVSLLMLNVGNGHTYLKKLEADAARFKGLMY